MRDDADRDRYLEPPDPEYLGPHYCPECGWDGCHPLSRREVSSAPYGDRTVDVLTRDEVVCPECGADVIEGYAPDEDDTTDEIIDESACILS